MDIHKILDDHYLWLKEDGGKKADFRGANFVGENLWSANLMSVNFVGANFEDANLMDANLMDAKLMGANFVGAKLMGANFVGAKGIYTFGPMPTSGRMCYAVWHGTHWMVQAGCFWGTLDELERKVKETHNCPVYLANIELLRNWKYKLE